MNKVLKLVALTGFVALIFSACSKEYSFEDPIGSSGAGPVIGTNCMIGKIIDFDTISKTGLNAINYSFSSSTGRLNSLLEFDSIGMNTVLNHALIYNVDTIFLDASYYFIVDGSGHVIKLHGLNDPYDPTSQILDFEYTYDNAGRIIRRTVTDPTLFTTPFLKSTYTYSGNNMTGVAVVLMDNAGNTAPLKNITIGYQFDRVPRNYMNILPDSDELSPFMAALNFGQKALNPVNKIQVINLDPFTGSPIDTATTVFSKYSYSRDGYVLGVDVSGDDIKALPFAQGRNNFEYFCR